MELGHDVFTGCLYVFTNRRHDKIKCLLWEDNGFVLYYKVLSEESFHWPATDEALLTLDSQAINWLLDGYNINYLKPHKKLRYDSCF